MVSLFKSVLTELLVVLRLSIPLLRMLVWCLTVRPPGFGVRVQVSEGISGMAQVFTYRQGLLPVVAGVASQRLVVSVDGVAQDPIELPAEATEAVFKAGPAGSVVTLSLDYLDAAGNDSLNAETSFVIVDGIPPAAPEGFGATEQIAEEDDGT